MRFVRNRARLLAAVALTWHVAAIAAVSTILSCDSSSEHATMENCPLHESAPACPLHGEQHGTRDCDCPTIGCSDSDTGFMALFGAAGILPHGTEVAVPAGAGDAAPVADQFAIRLAPAPLSPPPRL
jgi:hypothetical protein